MKIFRSLIIIIFIFISCNSRKEKTKAADEFENKEKQKQSIIEGLVAKYNIKYKVDTIYSDYSIDYKPIIESKYQLIEEFEINDIFEKDSILYISINPFGRIKELVLPIIKDQIELFTLHEGDFILVVSIKDVKKIKFSFEGNIEDEDNVNISLVNSLSFYAKGELVEIALIKN